MALRRRMAMDRTRWMAPHFTSPSIRSSSTEAPGSTESSGESDVEEAIVAAAAKPRTGDDPGCAAKLTINIKTAMREFRLGDIPNAKVCGLPTERSLFTVIRGPHIDKKSREQFDVQTRKWRITIDTEASKLRDKLEFLKEHRIPGVEIKARFQYKTRLPWPPKPTRLSDQEKWKLFKLRKKNPKLYTAAKLADEFEIDQDQVYHVLRCMEERQKHIDMFGENSS